MSTITDAILDKSDPHHWMRFERDQSGFVAETEPQEDARFLGKQDGATLVVHIDPDPTITSVTYIIKPRIGLIGKWMPGTTVTRTPTDPGWKEDNIGSPGGIQVTAIAGTGKVRFLYALVNRKLGGS